MSPMQQRKEVGLAVAACGNEFTINDAGSRRAPEDGRSDCWEPPGKIATVLAVLFRNRCSLWN
jgi:hypothetical protein